MATYLFSIAICIINTKFSTDEYQERHTEKALKSITILNEPKPEVYIKSIAILYLALLF